MVVIMRVTAKSVYDTVDGRGGLSRTLIDELMVHIAVYLKSGWELRRITERHLEHAFVRARFEVTRGSRQQVRVDRVRITGSAGNTEAIHVNIRPRDQEQLFGASFPPFVTVLVRKPRFQ